MTTPRLALVYDQAAQRPEVLACVVKDRERFVKSMPITVPGAASQCIISGRFDAVIAFGDGSYGIVDYKTSDAKGEQAAFYRRQLSAYAHALEHPAGAVRDHPGTLRTQQFG